MVIISVWLIILILCIVIEAVTPNLVTIWFIPAALVAFVFEALGAGIWLQIAAFIASGLVLLVTTKPLFEKVLRTRPKAVTNTDALIGKRALVVEDIDNLSEVGAVRIEGKIWSARSTDAAATIPVGEVVVICEIQGVKLICEKTLDKQEDLQ